MGDKTRKNRIDEVFLELAAKGKKALVTYIMAGDPDLAGTEGLIKALELAGADIIELGVPFSDPLADGPSIQRAGQRSLAAGTNLTGIFAMAAKLRDNIKVPLVLMTYYNPVLRFGLERFAEEAARSGIDGIIVPDLPLDESGNFSAILGDENIHLVPLLAPTSTQERIAQVAAKHNGFIYCVSLTGVTGARQELPQGVYDFVQKVKAAVNQPVAVGFGISKGEQVKKINEFADGVVVGSAIVDLVEKFQDDYAKMEAEIIRFVGNLKYGN